MSRVLYLVSSTHPTISAPFSLCQSFHGSLRKLVADGRSSLEVVSSAWEPSFKASPRTVSCYHSRRPYTILMNCHSCYVHHRSNDAWFWNCLLHCVRVCNAGRALLPQRTPNPDIYVQCFLVCRLSHSSWHSRRDGKNSQRLVMAPPILTPGLPIPCPDHFSVVSRPSSMLESKVNNSSKLASGESSISNQQG